LYKRLTGIYRFGNNTYPWRIRRSLPLGNIFWRIMCLMGNTVKCTIFSTGGVSSVKNFKYLCSGLLCCVCGLIILCAWLFLWLLFVDRFIFSFGVCQLIFNFPVAILLSLTLHWSVLRHILTCHCSCDAQWLRIVRSNLSWILGAFVILISNGKSAIKEDSVS
jgi:hypothetical protein